MVGRRLGMSFEVEVIDNSFFAQRAAARIAAELPRAATIVLTGGTTAEKIYLPLVETGLTLSGKDVFFSDERCVPPDHDSSNFAMATRTLSTAVEGGRVHRMRGEDVPEEAAHAYSEEVRRAAPDGFDLVLLGMGGDCHIAALFPGSPALVEGEVLCAAVDRPDGLKGLTLTPSALLSAKRILLVVSGEAKAEAVARAVRGDEPVHECPARLLADHPDATFVLDESAARLL